MACVNRRGWSPVGTALLTATTVDSIVRPRASTTSVANASVTCLAADLAGGRDAYTGVRIGRAGRPSGAVSDACLPASAAGARPLRTNVPRDALRSQEIGAASPSTIAATSRSVTAAGLIQCGRRRQPPLLEAREDDVLERPAMQQMADVDPPVLAETIDATDALLESQRIPRQFQRDDEAAALPAG